MYKKSSPGTRIDSVMTALRVRLNSSESGFVSDRKQCIKYLKRSRLNTVTLTKGGNTLIEMFLIFYWVMMRKDKIQKMRIDVSGKIIKNKEINKNEILEIKQNFN